MPKLKMNKEKIATTKEGISVKTENKDMYFILVWDPVLFLFPAK